jgi:zinc and cadmium transporter
MTLIAILLGTVAAGVGSVWLAALLSLAMLARFTQHMLSLAAGALMATAFMNLLPEAFESPASPQQLFSVLLAGLVFFFLLDKAELWHHGHEHHHPDPLTSQDTQQPAGFHHGHGHGHDHAHGPQRSGGWSVLAGDSVHAFGDGVLIASAFLADMRLGVITAVAVLAHEVPHHMGDLVVLRQTSGSRNAALVKLSMAGAVTALGGLTGYFLLSRFVDFLPYFLVAASSSFVYVALADLIPQLQKRLGLRETAAQVVWLLGGIALVTVVGYLAHHGH